MTPRKAAVRSNKSFRNQSDQLKDDVYRQMFRLEESRPGAGQSQESVEAAVAEAQRMVSEAKARVHAATSAAETQPHADPAPTPEPAAMAAPVSVPPSAATARTAEERLQAAWADAMAAVAGEFTAGLEDLPPEERWKEMARIKALTTAAGTLSSGAAPPPLPAMAAQ